MDHVCSTRRSPRSYRRTSAAALLAAVLTVVVAATALAAHPKAGRKYAGTTSAPKVIGFNAPVRFTVSAGGTRLLHFTYGSLGCLGTAGLVPGVNPFTGLALHSVSAITVAPSGRFTIAGDKRTFKFKSKSAVTVVTTTSMAGRFQSASVASGEITLTQKEIPPHGSPVSCGPVTVRFKTKVKAR